MANKYSTIQQHEPLRSPQEWGPAGKRFVAQLEEILDDIYRRFGRLKVSDLGDALRQSLSDTAGNVNTLTQKVTETESWIKTINGNMSTLTQNDKAFTAAFQSIGTMGAQTGVTKVTQDGVEVNHTAIDSTTKMNADGFKIYDANGAEIGGLVVIDGKVYLAAQSLMNPSTPGFRVGVAQKDFEGEQMGLHWMFGGAETGSISAHRGGMRQDVAGNLSLYPSKEFLVHTGKGIYIYGPNNAGIKVDDEGYMTLFFSYREDDGTVSRKTLSMELLYDAVSAVFPD